MINRLESCGFPVHRYHADRAQELKSRALVAWLRDRGIHGTWTPGDSPAGNKAELAVQQLKGSARKLLAASGLAAKSWPLAILHASNRHWHDLCAALGRVQVHLLPFGLVVHARQRTKTGFHSHWRSRTLEGKYLGHGGHLVLVPEGPDGKVLLTNTVYPVGPCSKTPARPRYRISGKRSPHFVVRSLQAVPFVGAPAHSDSRLSPGGSVGIWIV